MDSMLLEALVMGLRVVGAVAFSDVGQWAVSALFFVWCVEKISAS